VVTIDVVVGSIVVGVDNVVGMDNVVGVGINVVVVVMSVVEVVDIIFIGCLVSFSGVLVHPDMRMTDIARMNNLM